MTVTGQTGQAWPVWPNGWVSIYELSGSGFESSCSHLNFRFHVCFEQGVHIHIQATIECGFTLKRIRGMARTYSWNNACFIYAICANFAGGIFMHIRSCHNTFNQVDKLGMFELVNPNTRTPCPMDFQNVW